MNVFAVNIFCANGKQEYDNGVKQENFKLHCDIQLDEEQHCRQQNRENNAIVEYEDDLFRKFIGSSFCVKLGMNAGNIPNQDAQDDKENLIGNRGLSGRIPILDHPKCKQYGQSVQSIPEGDIVVLVFPRHRSCNIGKTFAPNPLIICKLFNISADCWEGIVGSF